MGLLPSHSVLAAFGVDLPLFKQVSESFVDRLLRLAEPLGDFRQSQRLRRALQQIQNGIVKLAQYTAPLRENSFFDGILFIACLENVNMLACS